MKQVKIIHIISENCNFYSYVVKRARQVDHFVFTNDNPCKPLAIIVVSVRVFCTALINGKSNIFVVFHFVDNRFVLLIRLLTFGRINYGFYYWGSDFYRDIVSEQSIENQCFAKSGNFYDFFDNSPVQHKLKTLRRFKNYIRQCLQPSIRYLKNYLVISNIEHCAIILSLSEMQYSLLEKFVRTRFPLNKKCPPRRQLEYYDTIAASNSLAPNYQFLSRSNCHNADHNLPSSNNLRVLICHSAVSSVNHFLSLALLKKYCLMWDISITIGAYLSYGGGDEAYRLNLADEIQKASDFFCSKCIIYTDYLSQEMLTKTLASFDIALFSCMRDEGVTSLSTFARLGGVVCFNQFSINYDFFEKRYPVGTLSHQELYKFSPMQIKKLRLQDKRFVNPPTTSYEDLASLVGKTFLS